MKNILRTLAGLFTALVLTACGNSTGDLIGLNNPLPDYTNTKVLKKVNYLETGTPAYDINYLYTAGKLTSVTTSDNSYSFAVDYNGSQITKITRTFNIAAQSEVMTSNLVYNGTQVTQINGTLATAGTVTELFSTDIAYSNGKVSQVKTQTYLPGTTVVSGTIITDIEYVGNNISKATYTETATGGPTNTIISTYSNYDTNPNPFRTLPTAYTLVNTNWELDIDAPIGLSANNAKTVNTQGASENVTYTYDNTGYPTQASAPSALLKFEYLTL